MSSEDTEAVNSELSSPLVANLAEEDAPSSLTRPLSPTSQTTTAVQSPSRSQLSVTEASRPATISAATSSDSSSILLTSTSPLSGSLSSSSYEPIPITAPAGSLVLTQPVATPGVDAALYKIAPGVSITLGWTLSDVLATPTRLTVVAVAGDRTYAIGGTGTVADNLIAGSEVGEPGVVAGTATEVVWDLDAYQNANPNAPLLQTIYTLSIWEDRGPKPTFRPGYMVPNNLLKFSMYTPQSYQSLDDGWTCASCSSPSAILLAHPASVSLVVTVLIMFLSGFHLLRAAPTTT